MTREAYKFPSKRKLETAQSIPKSAHYGGRLQMQTEVSSDETKRENPGSLSGKEGSRRPNLGARDHQKIRAKDRLMMLDPPRELQGATDAS
jgi:hypothetical protein